MKSENFKVTLVDNGYSTDKYLIEKLAGVWPETEKEIISFCDWGSTIKSPRHFGGVVENTNDVNVKKVHVYTD